MPLDSTFKDCYVMVKLGACHLSVYLRCGDNTFVGTTIIAIFAPT